MRNIVVLHINLATRDNVVKTYPDLSEYLGGVGISSKLVLDNLEKDPLVLAVGPLNGFFPFASKACAAFVADGNFCDTYVGGRLPVRFRFSGLDAIVFEKKSQVPVLVSITDGEVLFSSTEVDPMTLGIPGKRSISRIVEGKLVSDRYFSFGDDRVNEKFVGLGVSGLVVSGTQSVALENKEKYEKLYYEILGRTGEMTISAGDNPSCSGCPMGCTGASKGEIGGNTLLHSLVSCVYSEPIYSDIPTVFACLNSIGYDYKHEDLEALPQKIHNNIEKIYEKASDSQLEGK